MIELTATSAEYWNCRALAYVAAFYGNQLKTGGDWKSIRYVIGINILGGDKYHNIDWESTLNQYTELTQYSFINSPGELSSQEGQDWFTFFERTHFMTIKAGEFMTEEEVTSTIKTPGVLQTFERAMINNLPNDEKKACL